VEAAATVRIAVFGYASLASPASASQTLGRPVEIAAVARLDGWARAWTLGREQAASEKTFARADGSIPRYCLGLNIEPDPAARAPNGVLIELMEAELDRLDLRERRYDRVDVTESIFFDARAAPAMPFDRVIAYRAKPRHHHPAAPVDAVIVGTYPTTVEAAFDALGPGQLDLFRATTAPPPVPLVEGRLVRDEIPPGNPRAW
jgi:hypothetical protein